MAIADELRQYADKAIKEGGMYFSGNYLDGLAKRAESEQAENAKLRELVRDMWHEGAFAPGACYVETDRLEERTRELGVEVDA